MEFIFVTLLFGIFSGAIASAKNRSFFWWAPLGLFFGPFGLLVIFFPTVKDIYIDPDTGLPL